MPDRDIASYLDPAGLRVLGDAEAPTVRAECMRIARRLRSTEARIFGLVPMDDRTAVSPIGVQLGAALMHLSGTTVAYVDANTHWPALAPDRIQPRPGDQRGPFVTRWLQESLAILLPRTRARAGDAAGQLEKVLFDGVELFQYVLVDLTGFDVLGELEGVMRLVNQVILVARAGVTREADVLRRRDELLSANVIGALLVG